MKLRFPVISLSGEQIRYADAIAKARVESKIDAGRAGEKSDVLKDEDGLRRQHRTGARCEVGVALYGELKLPDLEHEIQMGKDAWAGDLWDLELPNGKKIDVKGTSSKLDYLQIFDWDKRQPDYFVRCWQIGNRVVLVGYQTQDFVRAWKADHEAKPPPEFPAGTPSYQIPISALWEVDEILLTPEGQPIGQIEAHRHDVSP
jgi:hypothetical protein